MNYHVAAGMKTVGISAAGGVAEATADEIIDGYSKYDMYELGINRFLGLHNNKRFLRDRVKEVPGTSKFCDKCILCYFLTSLTFTSRSENYSFRNHPIEELPREIHFNQKINPSSS